MRHLDDIHIGHCYEYYGEAAKIIDLDLSDDERYRILVACGRGFEDLEVVESSMHNREVFPEIGIAWQEYCYQKKQAKQYSRRARSLQRNLRAELKDTGLHAQARYNDWGGRGEIVIQGDLGQMTLLIDQLREGMKSDAC